MNTELAPQLDPPAARPKNMAAIPGFLLTLRGIWLLTWKSQFSWKRLPLRIISLLALPALLYLTTSTPQEWSRRHTLMGDPGPPVNRFFGLLKRSNIPYEGEQREALRKIFQEEFARTEAEPMSARNTTDASERRAAQIRDCYDRIQNRAQSLLNEQQYARFQDFKNRSLQISMQRTNEPVWNWTEPFYHLLMDFYFFIVLPLNCVRLCGGLIRDELQTNTLGFLTTRPVSRARLLVAKYLAHTAWLQGLMLIQTLLLFLVGYLRHIPGLTTLLPLLLVVQFLAIFAWSALGAFLGQTTSRYMALALVYGAVVELGIGRIPTNINALSLMRHMKTLLAHNAELQSIYAWPGTGVVFSLSALVLATGIFLSLAAGLFAFLEYHHASEMQK